MLDAPRQDWPLYESMSRDADVAWNRSLTPSDRFALYADLFDVVWEARRRSGVGESFDDDRWGQKLEIRRRLAAAFAQRDQQCRERAAAKNAG